MSERPIATHPTLPQYYGDDSQRQRWVNDLFDRTSSHYDWVDRVLSFGSGTWYRREVLRRAGLREGMRVIDVATGTGPVAAIAREIVGKSGVVIGIDPSRGMLSVAQQKVDARFVQAVGEALAIRSDSFDLLSMGYALRHVGDLRSALAEYRRVLKAGGEVVIMELCVPRSRLGRKILGQYMGGLVPFLVRVGTGSRDVERLMRYYWDTTAASVSPETILATLADVGFRNVRREVRFGILTEYRATK